MNDIVNVDIFSRWISGVNVGVVQVDMIGRVVQIAIQIRNLPSKLLDQSTSAFAVITKSLESKRWNDLVTE